MYKKLEKLKELRLEMEGGKQEYHAAKTIGLTQKTLGVWAKANVWVDKYRKALKIRCSGRRVDMVVDANFKSACEGNVAAQCFFLKNKAGWKDEALIDQSQHKHITYVWAKEDSDTLLPTGFSESHSRIEEAVQGS
jgi:hypothetical protein